MVFVPLHVHSQYSILDSTASVDMLVKKAVEYGCPALALTDEGNMFGAVDFYKACISSKISPILGCELAVAPFSRHEKKRIQGFSATYPMVFLVKNRQGYQNLCKLTSYAHLEGFYYAPRVDRELIREFSAGLICLTGIVGSKIGSWILEGREPELLEEIDWLQGVFGEDLFFEVQRHPMSAEDIAADGLHQEGWLYQKYQDFVQNQETVIRRIRELSLQKAIPCVAGGGIHYIDRADWKAQEILMNVQSGEPCELLEKDSMGNVKGRRPNPKREVMPSHEFYFKSPEQMERLFADMPEVLGQTENIASKCAFAFDFKAKYYPVFVPPCLEGQAYEPRLREVEAEKFLRDLCDQGIRDRYTADVLKKVQEKYPGQDPLEVVRSRLAYELEIITSKGMGDYLLIVYDFINWAKRQGIPMGPGRGSGAGSIILYLIGITDIEPLGLCLFFERFINPERISYPDIDVDICMERRQEVIDYTVQKYGKDRVAQIITFGTMKAKMALKDVGRVLDVPLSKVNALAKLIPEDPTMTLEKALEIDPDLKSQYQSDPEVHNLINLALKLEGSVRNTGIHAAGLIIGGQPLMEMIPLCSPKDSKMAVTQYSMKPVESVGLLKIDFLGLKTLTSIQRAVDAVEQSKQVKLNWVNLPANDQITFDLLNQGKTQGIFQVESAGMQDLLKQLHVDRFEEVIAVCALYRPGPMEMIPSFIQRKHGKEAIEIDHPWMADILAETYGIMVYQEQVMQIASKLAQYSLGEGDVLRRAMGKKDKEEMSKQREKFKKGASLNGIDEETSMRIFDKIEKFASYGFNKSHAAAYGYLTYVTAYLKANYPIEWFAALMTSDRDDVTKVAKIIRESRSAGIEVLPPCVNESEDVFVATSEGIRFAMSGIKGIGEGVVEAILWERKKRGIFSSLYNFIQRMDGKKVGKKAVECLIEAGAFDFTSWSRAALVQSVEPMMSYCVKKQKEEALGVIDFLAQLGLDSQKQFLVAPENVPEWSKESMLKREYELLGFYLKEHPLDAFKPLFSKLSCCPWEEWGKLDKGSVVRSAFIVESVSIKISAKTQKKFAILTISDGWESHELPIWSDLYEQVSHLLVETQLLYAILQVDQEEGQIKLQCRWLTDLAKVDDAVLKISDEIYDKVKVQAKLYELRGKKSSPATPAKPKVKDMTSSPVQIVLDMDKVKLSHILECKELFRKHAGDIPILLEFQKNTVKVACISIGSEWGISTTPALRDLLKKIPSIVEVRTLASV